MVVLFSRLVSSRRTVFSWESTVAAAVPLRFWRYAAAKALAQTEDCAGDLAWQLICRTDELAGTATDTFASRAVVDSGVRRVRAAMVATLLDLTICDSVSRLTALLVRPPATAAPRLWLTPVGVTLTVAVAV